MEVALICLSIVAALQALAIAFLCCTVPFLWWQRQKDRQDLDSMDEVVSELLSASGLRPDNQRRQPK